MRSSKFKSLGRLASYSLTRARHNVSRLGRSVRNRDFQRGDYQQYAIGSSNEGSGAWGAGRYSQSEFRASDDRSREKRIDPDQPNERCSMEAPAKCRIRVVAVARPQILSGNPACGANRGRSRFFGPTASATRGPWGVVRPSRLNWLFCTRRVRRVSKSKMAIQKSGLNNCSDGLIE